MSKKSIFLLILFLLVSGFFVLIKIRYGETSNPQSSALQESPTPSSENILSLSPNPITTISGKETAADIILEIHGNAPTLVQLEIAYDPTMLADMSITPGDFFAKSTVVLNNINPRTGRVSYALKPAADQPLANRTGTIATLHFIPLSTILKTTSLSFLPKTVIYEDGEENRLKVGYGASIIISPGVSIPQATTSGGFVQY